MKSYSENDITRTLFSMVDLFRKLRIPYMIIGAIAMNILARPRTTLDLDFLVLTDEKGLNQICKRAQKENFQEDELWTKYNPMLKGIQTRLIHKDIYIDILLPRDEHDSQALQRKKRKKFRHRFLYAVTPEDFVLQKLKVGRPRDFEDATVVMKLHWERLDLTYMKGWVKRLHISEEMDYVLNL